MPGPVAKINNTAEGFPLMSWHTDVIAFVQAPSSEVERECVSSVQLGCWFESSKSVQVIQGISEPPVGTQVKTLEYLQPFFFFF